MMKCEFEEMVGKEVTVETFDLYNAMYMATDVSKQEFVSMLDVKAIPEAPEAIERREKAEARRKAMREEIAKIKTEIERLKGMRELYRTPLDEFDKREFKWYGECIAREKARIAEIKFLMA